MSKRATDGIVFVTCLSLYFSTFYCFPFISCLEPYSCKHTAWSAGTSLRSVSVTNRVWHWHSLKRWYIFEISFSIKSCVTLAMHCFKFQALTTRPLNNPCWASAGRHTLKRCVCVYGAGQCCVVHGAGQCCVVHRVGQCVSCTEQGSVVSCMEQGTVVLCSSCLGRGCCT